MERINKMKKALEELIGGDYPNFIKAMVSIEKGIGDKETLDYIYDRYLEEDFNLLNDEIDFLKERLSEMKKVKMLTKEYDLDSSIDRKILHGGLDEIYSTFLTVDIDDNDKPIRYYLSSEIWATQVELQRGINKLIDGEVIFNHDDINIEDYNHELDKLHQIISSKDLKSLADFKSKYYYNLFEVEYLYEENLEIDEIEDEWDLER